MVKGVYNEEKGQAVGLISTLAGKGDCHYTHANSPLLSRRFKKSLNTLL